MSLLQDVLRSHTTDTLDKQNPDKDDSDDELVNVVRITPILPVLFVTDLRASGIGTRYPRSFATSIAAAITYAQSGRSTCARAFTS
jgi:hypothetical protein